MEQRVATNPINATAQGKIVNLSPNRHHRFSFYRDPFTNCFGETRYIGAQFIENERAGSARRQNPGRAHHLQRALRSNSIEGIVQQFLLNVIAIERMQRERFAIFHFFAFAWKLYSKAVTHKKFRGMGKEFHQSRHLDFAPFLPWLAQRFIKKWRRLKPTLSRDNSCGAIVRGVTEQLSVRLKISRTERLQRMSANGVVDLCFEILHNIIEQLAHQHTRREWLVVARRLPNITEIKNFARGKKTLAEKR